MAKLKPQTIDLSKINNRQEYIDGQGIDASFANGIFQANALVQSVGENKITEKNEDSDKTQVSIGANSNGAFFVIEGTKGNRGDSVLAESQSLSEYDETNQAQFGYPQQTINNIISHPNILLNGDFKINQRGKTSYTTSGYTVDRWLHYSTSKVDVVDDGIVFTPITYSASSGIAEIVQPIEEDLTGKVVTATISATFKGKPFFGSVTCLVYNKTNMPTANIFGSINIPEFGSLQVKMNTALTYYYVGLYAGIGKNPDKTPITVHWIKLEYGSVSTPFIPRNADLELLLCQRYYKRWNFDSETILPIGVGVDTERIWFIVERGEMYLYHSFIAKGYLKIVAENKLSLSVSGVFCSEKMLRFIIKTTDVEQGKAYLIQGASNNGYLAVDAEMY